MSSSPSKKSKQPAGSAAEALTVQTEGLSSYDGHHFLSEATLEVAAGNSPVGSVTLAVVDRRFGVNFLEAIDVHSGGLQSIGAGQAKGFLPQGPGPCSCHRRLPLHLRVRAGRGAQRSCPEGSAAAPCRGWQLECCYLHC